ncbi:MAG: ABC transporter substrate-binding protein, partial [Cytophagales bacterium]|nr:ABC transporter substrate-binding protein [Armatimonadota bacterium]
GGQGISVSSYSKNVDTAKRFLAWFETEKTQTRWAELGGLTANTKVAATDAFKDATPYNAVFTASVPYLKDFYNTPNYSELMNESQKSLNAAVAGAIPPKEALDALAKAQQKIVDAAGGG